MIVYSYFYNRINRLHFPHIIVHTMTGITKREYTMNKWILLILLGYSQWSMANWTLDNQSSQLTFNTTKNAAVTETHTFSQLTGEVKDNGEANLAILLNTVDTKIPLRDDRVNTMLFETSTYPLAQFTTKLDMTALDKLNVGESLNQTLQGQLQLHGEQKPLTADIKVTRLASNKVEIATVKPVMVDANVFNLGAGVAKLREIMQLKSIDTDVPVNFRLLYVQQ